MTIQKIKKLKRIILQVLPKRWKSAKIERPALDEFSWQFLQSMFDFEKFVKRTGIVIADNEHWFPLTVDIYEDITDSKIETPEQKELVLQKIRETANAIFKMGIRCEFGLLQKPRDFSYLPIVTCMEDNNRDCIHLKLNPELVKLINEAD